MLEQQETELKQLKWHIKELILGNLNINNSCKLNNKHSFKFSSSSSSKILF